MAATTDSKTEITLSDLAPKETVGFSFAQENFELAGKSIYRTDDPAVISEAREHPWLDVKVPKVDQNPQGVFHEQLLPKDDHLSAEGSSVNPNDPAQAAAAEKAKYDPEVLPVSIDANKEQTEPVVVDGTVAETVAADKTSKNSSKTKDKD